MATVFDQLTGYAWTGGVSRVAGIGNFVVPSGQVAAVFVFGTNARAQTNGPGTYSVASGEIWYGLFFTALPQVNAL